jgi:hypothetical protein
LVRYRNHFDPEIPVLPDWLVTWAVSLRIPGNLDDLIRYIKAGYTDP